MARRKGGWRSLLGLAKDREPAGKGGTARSSPPSVPASAPAPVPAPTPAPTPADSAPPAAPPPSESPSAAVQFTEDVEPTPESHVVLSGSLEAGAAPHGGGGGAPPGREARPAGARGGDSSARGRPRPPSRVQ